MKKKLLILITCILVSGVAAGWYFFTSESKYFGTPALKAVPVDTPFFIRIQNLSDFTDQTKNNPIWKELSVFNRIATVHNHINLADSLINGNPEFRQLFIAKGLTVVPDKGERLYLLEIGSFKEKREIAAFFDNYFDGQNEKPVKRKSGKATIYEYSLNGSGGGSSTFITYFRGICMMSTSIPLLEKAINQMDHPSLIDDANFRKVNKTLAQNIDVNLYFNHHYFPKFIAPVLSDSTANFIAGNGYGLWSEIDLIQKEDVILLNGFSFSDGTFAGYLDLFHYQEPRPFTLESYLPASTSFFMAINLDNPQNFFNDYQSFQEKQGSLDTYLASLHEANASSGIDLMKFAVDFMDGEAGVFYTEQDTARAKDNRLFLMKVSNGNNAASVLVNASKAFAARSGIKDAIRPFRIDQETAYDICRMPVNDFGKRLFGNLFSGVETSWFTVFDNCVVMGASYESVRRYLQSALLKETLANDPDFRQFSSELSQRSNLYLWVSPGKAAPFFGNILNPELFGALMAQLPALEKTEIGWQFSSENKMIYNSAKIKYNPVVKKKKATVWRSYLGSRIITQPQFVINPANKNERELVLQDAENNLYLINKDGMILWKVKLSGPVMGEVRQIDYFRDGKLQYLFNTREAIHLIDHSGNNIPTFPLALRGKATNSVSVFDYDNKRDYRFCVACDDRRVYLYDKKGRAVAGWAPEKSSEEVTQPVHHFRSGNKDYIVFFNRERIYILDRQGKERVNLTTDFLISDNDLILEKIGRNGVQLILTDQEGSIRKINFDGKSEKLTPGKFSPRHLFIYQDINGDKLPDYIYLDDNTLCLYDHDGTSLFSQKLEQKSDQRPVVVDISGENKIGVVSTEGNLIYLFNRDGSLSDNFPLEGNSPINIGAFNKNVSVRNLIAGSADGFLNNYEIK